MGVERSGQDPALLRRLLRAKDRMDAASEEEWPVERLASVSGVSDAHFARSFKEAFGVPPHRCLLTRRIERATALLREGTPLSQAYERLLLEERERADERVPALLALEDGDGGAVFQGDVLHGAGNADDFDFDHEKYLY